MSLLTENLVTGTFVRQTIVVTDAMGSVKTYTTAARGTLPTTGKFRLMKASVYERFLYGVQDENASDYLLFTTNPRLDLRDQVHLAATADTPARVLNVLTQTNVQELSRLWIVSCQESSRSVK